MGLWEMIWNIPKDYTIGDEFRWGNSLVVLFITQRSLLLGLPLALMVLGFLWQRFFGSQSAPSRSKKSGFLGLPSKTALPLFVVGFLAGTLPFVHAHSLAVLFVVSAFWFFFSRDRWKEWITFGAGVAVIAVPELLWLMSGSATLRSA